MKINNNITPIRKNKAFCVNIPININPTTINEATIPKITKTISFLGSGRILLGALSK